MPDKFIRHGETYNGDGTTSDAATSNGGVGAWNTIDYLIEGSTPAYGTLAAGDTVYIRSKSAAGADITVAIGATKTIGNAVGTFAAPLRWVLDSGDKWAGIDGVLTIETSSTFTVHFRNYNQFISTKRLSWVIKETNRYCNTKVFGDGSAYKLVGLYFDWSICDNNAGVNYSGAIGQTSVLTNCKWTTRNRSSHTLGCNFNGRLTLNNPEFEMLTASGTGGPTRPLMQSNGHIEVNGGRVYGAGLVTGVAIMDKGGAGRVTLNGFHYPVTVPLMLLSDTPTYTDPVDNVFGVDGGMLGAYRRTYAGFMSSRSDGYFPTLTAQLPTSTLDNWAWWVYPRLANKSIPLVLNTSKLYTSAPATKTVTLELLVGDAFSAVNKDTAFILVTYVENATGAPVCVSSQVVGGAALASSTAAWSATTYGAVNLNKAKISVALPTAIKQDTIVNVSFVCEAKSANENDILFVCPDFALT